MMTYMFLMLKWNVKEWQNIRVSGHRAVGRKDFCGPTFMSWFFLQVLETSPYGGSAAEILNKR
jgi:hypothetical protein